MTAHFPHPRQRLQQISDLHSRIGCMSIGCYQSCDTGSSASSELRLFCVTSSWSAADVLPYGRSAGALTGTTATVGIIDLIMYSRVLFGFVIYNWCGASAICV